MPIHSDYHVTMYKHFAHYYDGWMDGLESPYVYFVYNILPSLIPVFSLPSLRLCDLGCGTGRFVDACTRIGLDCDGVDISTDMLRVARDRCGRRARFFDQDIRCFEQHEHYGAVTILGDTINHLRSHEDLRVVLAAASRMLLGGGILILDYFTMDGFKRLWNQDVEFKMGDASLQVSALFDKETGTAILKVNGHEVGCEQGWSEEIIESFFEEEVIRKTLVSSGFSYLANMPLVVKKGETNLAYKQLSILRKSQ